MKYTFKHNQTINYYIFRRSLKKDKFDLVHYIEVSAAILLLIGFLTCIISQIQIFHKERKPHGKHTKNFNRTT